MATSITVELVLGDNGKIDRNASGEAFEHALDARISEIEEEGGIIADHVDNFFINNKGATITLPNLANDVVYAMKIPFQQRPAVAERVAAYIRANSQGKVNAETKVQERPDSRYFLKRGPKGGVMLRSDMPVLTEE
jgi:hypothetical protein